MKSFPLITILFLILSFTSNAQDWDYEKPDYELIKLNIEDEDSNLFYESLMDRYLEGDSTFTLVEKRHLYYGYIYHDKYTPYPHSDYNDSLRVLMQSKNHDKPTLEKIVSIVDIMVESNPFDFNAINYQMYALDKLGNNKKLQIRMTQVRMLVDALMSSGIGTEIENAFYVISTSHEYFLVNILGFEFGGEQRLTGQCDYLVLKENDAEVKGLYFDVSPCLNALSKTQGK